MQFGQHWPRFCALLIDKAAAGLPVEAECVTRPAAPVKSRHLVGDECLIQRVLSQQVAKLTYQVRMPAKLQLTLDALQDGRPAFLFEAVTHPRHPVAADPCQRLTAPEPVRLAQQHGRMIVVAACGQCIRLPAQPAELMQVDRLGIDVEHVASSAPRQPDAIVKGLPERRSKPGDVDRQTLSGLWRRPGIPQPVDEGLNRHDRARRQQEDGQDTPRPGWPKITLLPGRPKLNRPERPEFHDRLAFLPPVARSHLVPEAYIRNTRRVNTRCRQFSLESYDR